MSQRIVCITKVLEENNRHCEDQRGIPIISLSNVQNFWMLKEGEYR